MRKVHPRFQSAKEKTFSKTFQFIYKRVKYFLYRRCILSPVSSAVILPALLEYKKKGLDKQKGIITLVMAACSFDDIFAISAFGVCLSIIFSAGKYLSKRIYFIEFSKLNVSLNRTNNNCSF